MKVKSEIIQKEAGPVCKTGQSFNFYKTLILHTLLDIHYKSTIITLTVLCKMSVIQMKPLTHVWSCIWPLWLQGVQVSRDVLEANPFSLENV
jgi:hypothetical protein